MTNSTVSTTVHVAAMRGLKTRFLGGTILIAMLQIVTGFAARYVARLSCLLGEDWLSWRNAVQRGEY